MMEDDTLAARRRSGSVALTAGGQASQNHSQKGSKALDRAIMEHPSAYDGPSSSESNMEDSWSDQELDEEDEDDDEETGLTHAQRKKRRRRKNKNIRLDERVAGDGDLQKTEDQLATATMVRSVAINAALIGLWYSFSISISVYNKWMFSKSGVGGKEKGLDFHFPLFTTSIHMIVQFSFAAAVLYFFPRFRPKAESSRGEYTQLDGADKPPQKPLMTKWFYLSRIGPCGSATALDIGLGNFSLRFISLTFYTMCKSSVLGFVLIFAFIFRLEKPTWKLCAIIIIMTSGVIMMVAGETAFNAAGFVLVMSASACSGFRWSLTQILLLRNPATSNPFSSIFFLTPVMFLALFVLALPVEGPANIIAGIRGLAEAKGWFLGAVIMLFPGCLAFMMVAAEFALLKRSSVVTLSVCGIFKEVLTISVASIVFGDELSPINLSGLIVTILSIAGYNYLKWMKMSEEAHKKAHAMVNDEAEGVPMRDSRELPKGAGSFEDEDEDARGGLMRDSLSLPSDANGQILRGSSNGTPASHSPVKRPEDIE